MTRDLRNQNPDDQSGPHDANQELQWLAFRYVSDEMPRPERDEFEKRLETDSDAQSALVDAMQSTQLIYAALDSEKKTVQLPDRSAAAAQPLFRRQSALLAAAAAILLIFGGWAIYNSGAPDPTGVADSNSNSTELAVAWADTLFDRDLVMLEAELDELAEDVEFEDFITFDSSEETKDWMFITLVDLAETEESAEGPQ